MSKIEYLFYHLIMTGTERFKNENKQAGKFPKRNKSFLQFICGFLYKHRDECHQVVITDASSRQKAPGLIALTGSCNNNGSCLQEEVHRPWH